MGINKRGVLFHQGDIGVGEDALDPSTQLRDNLGLSLTGLSEGGAVHIGFRGDAPHIQTSATHLSTFEDNDLQSLLGSVFRSAITSWACAHYN